MPFPGSSWYARARRAPDDAPQHMPRLCCEYGNVALPLRPALGDDVPVPGTGLALQLLLQRQQLEAGEWRNQGRRIAIEMRVPGFLGPVADKGVGGDGAASSVIDVARRQHRALVEGTGLQHAPDLGEAPPDIAQGPVVDHIPRQHKIEAAILERQRIGRSLAHAQRYAPGSASNSACRPTPQPRSSAVRAPRAFSSGNSAMTSSSGSSQSARPPAVAHRLSQASIAVVTTVAIPLLPHRRLSPPHPNPAAPSPPAAPRDCHRLV